MSTRNTKTIIARFLAIFLLFGHLQAQEGLNLQYFEDGHYILQPPSTLQEQRVKEVRFVLVTKRMNEKPASGIQDTSRLFVLKGGFPEGFGDAVVDIDSLTGQLEQLMVRGARLNDVYRFTPDQDGRRIVREAATSLIGSPTATVHDSTIFQFDAQGRLVQETQMPLNISPYRRHTTRYDYDSQGRLSREVWLSTSRSRWTDPWPPEKDSTLIEVRNTVDENQRLARTEYWLKDSLMAMDSLVYVPDGRLKSKVSWDKLHPRHPQYKSMTFDGEGRLASLLVQYPHHRRRKRISFTYNEYGLLMQYSYFDEKNRAVVMELHYDFFQK